ncbi:MAG: transporter-associated protein EcsC [Caulobacteraceae bacterium]|nr:transporter-associated protein EcsC [Caulobacteraceae bacterium]
MDQTKYELRATAQVEAWKVGLLKEAGLFSRAAGAVQGRINRIIPERIHAAITGAIEHMTRAMLTGADYIAPPPPSSGSLEERDHLARARIGAYRATAAAEGGIAGSGGFLLAAADFPVLIGIKIKLLFDLAAIYGHDGGAFRERLYILSVFQLAFSGPAHRREILLGMEGWEARADQLPESWEAFDWRRFQQEYRDYIDLAKLAQLLPVVGAPVGAFVNYRLLDRLGETAINAYRMRWLALPAGRPA